MNIAIIPARGGSKRIPRKNIKLFHGKPIIAYSIEAAQNSKCFDRIIVSTDDQEIAQIALQYGAEVPFMRPVSIADDHTGTLEVIQHTINELTLSNETNICCLYATAPLITAEYLVNGLQVLEDSNCSFVFSAAEFSFPIQRAFYFKADNSIQMFQPGHAKTRSQDVKKAYHDAGQFYWATVSTFKNDSEIFSSYSKAITLPRTHVQDIDTLEDWNFAELLFKLLQPKDK